VSEPKTITSERVVGVVRNFFDIATEFAFYRIAEHVKRATAKRPRNDMSLP
jgi:hypothetical protein